MLSCVRRRQRAGASSCRVAVLHRHSILPAGRGMRYWCPFSFAHTLPFLNSFPQQRARRQRDHGWTCLAFGPSSLPLFHNRLLPPFFPQQCARRQRDHGVSGVHRRRPHLPGRRGCASILLYFASMWCLQCLGRRRIFLGGAGACWPSKVFQLLIAFGRQMASWTGCSTRFEICQL